MSLEAEIKKLTEAVLANTAALQANQAPAPAPKPKAEEPKPEAEEPKPKPAPKPKAEEPKPKPAPKPKAEEPKAEAPAPDKKTALTPAVQAAIALARLKGREAAKALLAEFDVAKAGELTLDQVDRFVQKAIEASELSADDFAVKMTEVEVK